jgi:2-oxoglutarate dehydrogenase E1 component
MNAGGWTYVQARFRSGLNVLSRAHKGAEPAYAGRPPSASPATGNKKQHAKEEKELLSQAFFDEVRKVQTMRNGVPIF